MRLRKGSRVALAAVAFPLVAWTVWAVVVRWRPYPKELLERGGASSLTVTDSSGAGPPGRATGAGAASVGRVSSETVAGGSSKLTSADKNAGDRCA